MGQAQARKKNGTYPTQTATKLTERDIRPVVSATDDTVIISLVDFNGRPSYKYSYATRTGTVTKDGLCSSGEWIGGICVSPSMASRVWVAAKNLFKDINIPTEPAELQKFIDARGDKGPWYRLGNEKDEVVGGVYLPRLLAMGAFVQQDKDKLAVISNAVVAPKYLGKGYGTALHIMAAGYFKSLGYEKLKSDFIGMNTDAELAVWKRLEKEFTVEGYVSKGFSVVGLMKDTTVIDDGLARLWNAHSGMYINGKLMTLKEISETEFQQYEMDLTDERIPMLLRAAS